MATPSTGTSDFKSILNDDHDGLLDANSMYLEVRWSLPRIGVATLALVKVAWHQIFRILTELPPHDLASAIQHYRAVQAAANASLADRIMAHHRASLASLSHGMAAQAAALWTAGYHLLVRERHTWPVGEGHERKCAAEKDVTMRMGALAIQIHMSQPSWPLWGELLPKKPAFLPPEPPPKDAVRYRERIEFRPAELFATVWAELRSVHQPEVHATLVGLLGRQAQAIAGGNYDWSMHCSLDTSWWALEPPVQGHIWEKNDWIDPDESERDDEGLEAYEAYESDDPENDDEWHGPIVRS